MSVARVWQQGWQRWSGFSQFSAFGFAMAALQATLRCGLIWIRLSLGIVWSGYFLGWVRLLGRYLIVSLGGGYVDSWLAMGRTGMGLVFFRFGASGFDTAAGFGDVALWNYFLWWPRTGVL